LLAASTAADARRPQTAGSTTPQIATKLRSLYPFFELISYARRLLIDAICSFFLRRPAAAGLRLSGPRARAARGRPNHESRPHDRLSVPWARASTITGSNRPAILPRRQRVLVTVEQPAGRQEKPRGGWLRPEDLLPLVVEPNEIEGRAGGRDPAKGARRPCSWRRGGPGLSLGASCSRATTFVSCGLRRRRTLRSRIERAA
jgi:hypothetical protein